MNSFERPDSHPPSAPIEGLILAGMADVTLEVEQISLTPRQLAAQLQPLDPLLGRVKSEHRVFRGEHPSAAQALAARYKLPPGDPGRRGTDILAQRALFLAAITDNEDSAYLDYYTPDEVIELSRQLLEVESQWADDTGLAGLMAEVEPIAHTERLYASRDDNGYYDYMTEAPLAAEAEYATGYEAQPAVSLWDGQDPEVPFRERLADGAQQASTAIRHFMLAGNHLNVHRHKYLVSLAKPPHAEVDAYQLRTTQQFVADNFALRVIGERKSQSDPQIRQQCLENAAAIEEWFAEHQAVIDQLPSDFRLVKPDHISRSRMDRIFQNASARAELRGLVHIMRARLNSGEQRGFLRSLDADPAGFHGLQTRIAIAVNRIREQLPHYVPASELSVTPITPLE